MNISYGLVSQKKEIFFFRERLCFEEKCLRLTLRMIGFELFFFNTMERESMTLDVALVM